MPTDTILEELHRYREEYAARFNYDIDAVYRDLKAKEQANPRPVIPPPEQAPKGVRTRVAGVAAETSLGRPTGRPPNNSV